MFEWKSVSHTHRAFGSKFSSIYKTNLCIISSIFSFFIKFREYYSFNWHKYFESCDLYMFVCTCKSCQYFRDFFYAYFIYWYMYVDHLWMVKMSVSLQCIYTSAIIFLVLTFITDPSLVYHINHDFTDSFYLIINLGLNLIVFRLLHDISIYLKLKKNN